MARVAQPKIRFTRADYDRLPEDLRVELIDGELVKMPPPTVRHQQLCRRLVVMLTRLVDEERVYFAPVDLPIDDFNALQPDILVLAEDGLPAPGARSAPTPLLVVEVLSPSTAARDRRTKAALYFGKGVREMWLVDPDARAVEVSSGRGWKRFAGEERVRSRAVPAIEVALADLFRG